MKYICEIEYQDYLGENWMNKDNLQVCINSYCENKDGNIKVHDLASEANERIKVLEAALRGLYEHTKNDRQIAGLNTAARKALEVNCGYQNT
jgi:hypothetical protein